MEDIAQSIPASLIYEVVNGKPIYYKGYKDYLNGTKQLDEIMGSSYIQSLVITKLVYLLISKLDKKYQVLTSEVELQFKEKRKRAADIAIFEKAQLKAIKDQNKYLQIPPKIIIEIDIKAALEEVQDPFSYFHKKTDELLNNGVGKVIWIFTDSRKIMISEKEEIWQIFDWSHDIAITENLVINLEKMIEFDEEE